MNSKSSIKFRFEVNLINNDILNNIFSKLDSLLNIRFDENSNPYVFANNEIYEFMDFSSINQEDIEGKIDSFFSFTFTETVDVSLYKFLVLKNDGRLDIRHKY